MGAEETDQTLRIKIRNFFSKLGITVVLLSLHAFFTLPAMNSLFTVSKKFRKQEKICPYTDEDLSKHAKKLARGAVTSGAKF